MQCLLALFFVALRECIWTSRHNRLDVIKKRIIDQRRYLLENSVARATPFVELNISGTKDFFYNVILSYFTPSTMHNREMRTMNAEEWTVYFDMNGRNLYRWKGSTLQKPSSPYCRKFEYHLIGSYFEFLNAANVPVIAFLYLLKLQSPDFIKIFTIARYPHSCQIKLTSIPSFDICSKNALCILTFITLTHFFKATKFICLLCCNYPTNFSAYFYLPGRGTAYTSKCKLFIHSVNSFQIHEDIGGGDDDDDSLATECFQ
ncbi:hypothetical protein EGR_09239 [Echinococcus granulosus]|uniref:Uncharacterized protein n=1 Tax=Echinococcus granulosus TaxID=6210 RepID=W6UBR7_ECHGR|nr:hypothetical protein EGR_09239 [Echinococcus granulosus]EUB55882.1 hypothetical protein EGR_09239 [Echinococcus granulosus]